VQHGGGRQSPNLPNSADTESSASARRCAA
jgi:hypothetical protein